MIGQVTLILGGARSGKSRLGESLATKSGLAPVYIATAEAGDAEMVDRIARHRADRGPEWTNIEEPLALADMIRRNAGPECFLLVDCLTLWISNLMHKNIAVENAIVDLIDALDSAEGPVALISNEVGLGIVPDNALARAFRDHAGRCHQAIANHAETVIFCVSGLPLVIKEHGQLVHSEYAF